MMQLTIAMPFYRNCSMLKLQYDGWAAWPEAIKQRVSLIIVDDGSPEPAADVERPSGLPQLSIYRVSEDRPWHQHAARNLAAHVAQAGWMLLTDMDHVLSEEAARKLLKNIKMDRLDPQAIYMLDRVEADTGLPTRAPNGAPKPHPNSFVVTRDLYWRIGGYDEEFRGYGTDGMFKSRAFTVGRKDHLKGIALQRYSRDIVPDASTTTMGRKEPEWRCDTRAVVARKAAEGRTDKILTLDFPWERVI